MTTLSRFRYAPDDWSLSLQVFLYLQLLDLLSTWIGFRAGLSEASPFVRFMPLDPHLGVLAQKFLAFFLGAFCLWTRKLQVIRIINYWYAALVVWNLALILTR